jgi:uncharacterized protein
LLSRLRQDLVIALKARDRVAVAALRSAIAAIENAQAVEVDGDTRRQTSSAHIAGASAGVGSSEVDRRELSEADMQALIRQQADERHDAADEYERRGRADTASRLRDEAAVLLTVCADG